MVTISIPREWQAEAAPVLLGKARGLLVAPPGQGKSFMGMAWAAGWAARGKKTLIVSPRTSIKGSFGQSQAFCVGADGSLRSDPTLGQVIHYKAIRSSLEDRKTPGKTLKSWLLRGLEDTSTYVGTHQELMQAIKRLNLNDGWVEDLAVVVDEAHFLEVTNGIGKLVTVLSERGVPLLLMTATPFRRDGGYIVPPDLISQFEVYNRTMGQSLDEMKYLRGIGSQIVVGTVSEALRAVLREIRDNNRYAVLRFPEVNSHHARRWAQELGLDDSRSYKYGFEREVFRICEEEGVENSSVATDDTNDDNLFHPEVGIINKVRHANRPEGLPRLIISQNKVEVGTDCPWWTDSIMIGASGSCVRTIQFGQRCCRDHFSKEGKVACAWTLVPNYWEPGVSIENIATLTQDLIKYQLWSLFVGGVDPPRMGGPAASRQPEPVDPPPTRLPQSPDVMAQKNLAILARAMRGFAESEDELRAAVTLLDEASKKAPIRVNPPGATPSDGNEIHRLPGMKEITFPQDVLRPDASVEEMASALREYAHTLGACVLRGDGLKFETRLRTENIGVIIKGHYLRGWDTDRIARDVAWAETEVVACLQDMGLIHRPPKRARYRGDGPRR